ncbi:trypsin-like serine peptidase [Streptomyces orinoci]|uniref:FG-GAP-like repeat-containing protein n=1 Tax=Streptomyces orinoci TaxID=67339 RepID=A0ABV3K4X9_STRON|nr:FG-GAP-like repeat-containing protein [Streptomyces orinoci]
MRTSRTRIRRIAVSAIGAAVFLTSGATLAHADGGKPGPAPTHTAAAPNGTRPGGKPGTAPAPKKPAPTASSTTAANSGPVDKGFTDADALRFWTPERMASAVDPARPAAPPKGKARRPAPSRSGVAADMPTAEHILGLKSVGALFSYKQDPTTGQMHAHNCSASVVESPGRDLILTAGHCAGGKAVIFVPWYATEKPLDQQQFGFFRVADWFTDSRFSQGHQIKTKESDLDFSFGRLEPSASGQKVQDVVGANTLARTPSFNNNVTMVGYPMAKYEPEDHPVRCPTQTWALPGYYQIQALCHGMYSGTSGGPWYSKVDWAKGTGEIIGNVGGYNGGGNDANVDWLTYSPVHGDWFFRLYEEAKANQHVGHGSSYEQPPLPYSMGGGDTWKHAKLMASGDFNGNGHSDMIVVWTDGEVTMYYSDGKGHFTSERQLVAKDSIWKDAETITAGDFTGSNQFDLMVRWVDGEVTLYGDVGSNGLNWAGKQLVDPKKTDLWKHATQIAAGRFGSSQYVTDLMVRWSDGELTLYTNVGAGGFGQEHKLKDKNETWTHATLLTSGEFSGSARWDLMVQWSDGELDNYVNTNPSGLGNEARIQDPNGLWTHNTVMTTGNFTANGRTDDVVVRWSDGETTMYMDSTTNHMGIEENLVPHA